jgi:hypothetical protein
MRNDGISITNRIAKPGRRREGQCLVTSTSTDLNEAARADRQRPTFYLRTMCSNKVARSTFANRVVDDHANQPRLRGVGASDRVSEVGFRGRRFLNHSFRSFCRVVIRPVRVGGGADGVGRGVFGDVQNFGQFFHIRLFVGQWREWKVRQVGECRLKRFSGRNTGRPFSRAISRAFQTGEINL